MELKDMFPSDVSFNLTINNETKTIWLSKINISDHAWVNEIFDCDIPEALQSNADDMLSICRLVYRQVTPESRELFNKVTGHSRDEDGNQTEIAMGGYTLLNLYLKNISEIEGMMEAYQKCFLLSMPALNGKKKLTKKEKKLKKLLGL